MKSTWLQGGLMVALAGGAYALLFLSIPGSDSQPPPGSVGGGAAVDSVGGAQAAQPAGDAVPGFEPSGLPSGPPPGNDTPDAPAAPRGDVAPRRLEVTEATASSRTGVRVVRSLIGEAARAELWAGGQMIGLGVADQQKYLGARWGNQTFGPGQEGDTMFLQVSQGFEVSYQDWEGGARVVVVQGRSETEGQRMSVWLDGVPLGERPMTVGWSRMEYVIPTPTVPGPRKIAFAFATPNARGAPAELDWIWMMTREVAPPSTKGKVALRTLGDPRRALVADPPRKLSYYLPVPPAARLRLSYGATQATRFTIRAHQDGKPARVLMDATRGDGRWHTAGLDLSALAGQVVRLELSTDGKGGEAGWAEPEVVIAGRPHQLRPVTRPARNVLHFVGDALRPDMFRFYNPKSPVVAPAAEALARRSTVFDVAYAQANWTLPSASSYLTGRYPVGEGSDGLFKLSADIPLLPEHLRREGFRTAAVVANRFISGTFGLARGWDKIVHFPDPAHGHPDTDGKPVIEAAIRWLREVQREGKRFYLYVHTMDTHIPYRWHEGITDAFLGKPYMGKLGRQVDADIVRQVEEGEVKLTSEDIRYLWAMYRGEVVYHDRLLGQLLDELGRLGLTDSTLVLLHADHGEELGEHGGMDHGHGAHEEMLRVPLLMSYPAQLAAGARVRRPVELVDLLPTILELTGIRAMSGMHGKSLRRAILDMHDETSHYVIMGSDIHAVRIGGWKYWEVPNERRLYDLRTDPGERRDLSASYPVARRVCQVYQREGFNMPNKHIRLRSAMHLRADEGLVGEEVVLDPATERQLRALGYIN